MIDGFSDALSGSVAEAVQQSLADLSQPLREAARQAVKEALADPTLWPASRPRSPSMVTMTPKGDQPGPLVRAAAWLEGAGARAAQTCRAWWQAGLTEACQRGREQLRFGERAWLALLMLLPLVWMLRWHIVVAAGSSLALGVLVLVAGPAVAVVLGMAGSFALVLLGLVVAYLWLSQLARLPVQQGSEPGCSQPSELS